MNREKRNSGFISIGKEIFIKGSDVQQVLDYESKEARRRTRFAIEQKMFYNCVARTCKRLSVIITNDGRVFGTGFLPKTIIERLAQVGFHFLKVGSGLFLSVNQIDSFYGFNGVVATQLRKARLETANISLVRKTKQRKTTILLKTGECVSVACTPEKIVEAIGDGLAKADRSQDTHDIEISKLNSKWTS